MSTWNGGLKFVGDEGVQVNATAHSTEGVIDDVLVTHVAPVNGTHEQRQEVERLRGIARGFIGQYSGAWTGQGSVYDARRPNPSRRTTKRHGVLHDEYGPFNPDGTRYQGWNKPAFSFRPAYVPPKSPLVDADLSAIEARALAHDGAVTFRGNEGVNVTVIAHATLGVVDGVQVIQVDYPSREATPAQRAEIVRLTDLAGSLMVGKPSRAFGPIVDATTPKEETVDYPGCTTREQAEALGREELRKSWQDSGDELAREIEAATQQLRTPSNTLSRVLREMRDREQFGLSKYGTTVDRTDLSVKQWLQHAKEEAMDSVLYLDRLIQEEERRALPPEGMFADVKYKSVLDELPPDLAKAIRKFFKLDHCEHNTAVTLSDVWVEAFFGHGDVGLPNAKTRRRTPTESFFDTRLSA